MFISGIFENASECDKEKKQDSDPTRNDLFK